MSVFVIDCTTIGRGRSHRHLHRPRSLRSVVDLGMPRFGSSSGAAGKILCAGGTDWVPSLTAFPVVATLAVALEPGFRGCRKLGLNGVAPRNMVLWRTVLSGAGQCVRLER